MSRPLSWPTLRGMGAVKDSASRPKNGLHPQQTGGYDSWKWERADAYRFGRVHSESGTAAVLEALKTVGRGDVKVTYEIWTWADRNEWWVVCREGIADPVEIPVPSPKNPGEARRLLETFGLAR